MAPDEPRGIAIAVEPDQRARAERIWRIHNSVQPITASKSAVYRSVIEKGLQFWEAEIERNGYDKKYELLSGRRTADPSAA